MVQICSGFVSVGRVAWKVKQQQLHFQSYFFAQRHFAVKYQQKLKGKLLLRECYLSLRKKSSTWHFLFLIDQILQGILFRSKMEAGVWLPAVEHSPEWMCTVLRAISKLCFCHAGRDLAAFLAVCPWVPEKTNNCVQALLLTFLQALVTGSYNRLFVAVLEKYIDFFFPKIFSR